MGENVQNLTRRSHSSSLAGMDGKVWFLLWSGAALLVGGWLAFKVASKWAVWQNIIKVPESAAGLSDEQLVSARFRFGTHLLQRFLLGTLGNVLAALFGVALGKLLVQILS